MFDTLSEKFEQTVKRLRGHGKITERNIDDAVREVRLALLEADVQFDVVRNFTDKVRERAIGQEVLRSLTPEQHFIKIVRDQLTELMGGSATPLNLAAPAPVVVMMVGLYGPARRRPPPSSRAYLTEGQQKRADWFRPTSTARRRSSS